MAFIQLSNAVDNVKISGVAETTADYGSVPVGTNFKDINSGTIMYMPTSGVPYAITNQEVVNTVISGLQTAITESGVLLVYAATTTFNKKYNKIVFPAFDLVTPTPNALTFTVTLDDDALIRVTGAKDKEYIITSPPGASRNFSPNASTFDWGNYTPIVTIPAGKSLYIKYTFDEITKLFRAIDVRLDNTNVLYQSNVLSSTANQAQLDSNLTNESAIVNYPLMAKQIGYQKNVQVEVKAIQDLATYPSGLVVGDKFLVDNATTIHTSYGSGLTGVAKNDIIQYVATNTWAISTTAASIAAGYTNAQYYIYNLATGYVYFYDKTGNIWRSSNFVNKLSRICTVDALNGKDEPSAGSRSFPYKTIAYALTQINNSGWRVEVMPGTYQLTTDTLYITQLNVAIVAIGLGTGNVYIQGTVNISATGSSTVGMFGITTQNLVISGSVNTYLTNCAASVSFSKTGSGYCNPLNCDFGNSTTVSVTGTGTTVFDGGSYGYTVINNAAAIVAIKNTTALVMPTLTAGTLVLRENDVYAASSAVSAITTSANTVLSVSNCRCYNANDGTTAKLTIAGAYTMNNVQYNRSASTINELLNLDSEVMFDKLRVNGALSAQYLDVIYNSAHKKAYPSGVVVYKDGALYKSNGNIPVGTTWAIGTTGATWTSLSGSGGGGSTGSTPKTPVVAVLNANINPSVDLVNTISFQDNDKVALYNVSNLNTYWVLESGVTLPEPCIIKYVYANNNWVLDTDLTTVTQADGDYQLWDNYRRSTWVLDKSYAQLNEIQDNGSSRLYITGKFQSGAGFISTYDQSNNLIYKQVSAGVVSPSGSPTLFGVDANGQAVKSIIDGTRLVSFEKMNVGGGSGTLTYQVSTSLSTISYGTAVTVGTCYYFNAFAIPTGGFVTVEANALTTPISRGILIKIFIWNGTAYTQLGSTISLDTGTTPYIASLDASEMLSNNMMEIFYSLSDGTKKRVGVQINTSVSPYATTYSATHTLSVVRVFKAGTGGKAVLLYRVGNVLTAKMLVRNAGGTTSDGTATISFPNPYFNEDKFNSDAKNGYVLLTYTYNNALYCRWLDVSGSDITATSETQIYIGDSYCLPAMGTDQNGGVAMVKFNDSALPQAVGWTKNGSGIIFSFPGTNIGDRSNFDYSNTAINSFLYTGTNYIYTFAGTAGGISPVLHPESGVVTYTANVDVIPEGILQSSGNNSVAFVAWDGDESRVHSGLVPNVSYYFYFGALTTTQTYFYAGEAASTTSLRLDINDETRINNLITQGATNSSQLAGHETRITTLEATYTVEKPIQITQGGATLFILTNKGRLLAATGSVNNYWNIPGTGVLKSTSFGAGNYDSYQARGIENARQVLFIGSDGKNNTSKVRQVVNLGWTVAVVLEDNTLWGWGDNIGAYANGASGVNSLTPILLTTSVQKIWENKSPADVNNSSRIALFIQTLDGYTWGVGNNYYGHFGLGNTAGNGTDTLQGWTLLTWIGQNARGVYPMGNYYHSLIVEKADGTVLQTGYNGDGCMGNGGNQTNQINPVDITTNLKGAGNQSTYSIINVFGGRGYTDTATQGNATTIVHLSTGTGKVVKTAGSNIWGSLGTGGGTNTTYGWFTVPTNAIAGSSGDYIDLVAGGGAPMTAIAIKNKLASSQPELVGWGYNGQYNIDETNTQRNSPIGIIAYSSTLYPTKILNTRLGCFYTYQYYPDQIMVEFMENGKKVYYMHGRNTEGECGNGTTLNNNVNPWSKVLFPDGVNITLIGRFSTTDGAAAVMVAYDDANNRWYAWGNASQYGIDGLRSYTSPAPQRITIKELTH